MAEARPATLDSLACVATAQGDSEQAAELFAEGLALSHEQGNRWVLLFILGHLAELAVEQGKAERATWLAGAEAAGRQATGTPLVPVEQEHRERALDRARQQLGEERFRQSWEAGQAMTLEQAVSHALNEM